jgi:hypothetical protein
LPLELAHNGQDFLAKQFCISRDLIQTPFHKPKQPLTSAKIFILYDPAPWAKEIKESLVQNLKENFPNISVQCSSTSEPPLNIVQNMYYSDIFHVIGYCSCESPEIFDYGWTLSPRKNLFKLRVLQNAPKKPRLVFHQSNWNNIVEQHNFLAAIHSTNVDNTVSVLWPIQNLDVSFIFYSYFFQGMDIGEAIQKTRLDFAQDAEIALSLVLYGSPNSIIGKML